MVIQEGTITNTETPTMDSCSGREIEFNSEYSMGK